MSSNIGGVDLLNLFFGEYSIIRELNLNARAVFVIDPPLLRVETELFQTSFEYVRFLIAVSDDVVWLEFFVRHFWASFDTDEALELFCDGGHAGEAFIQECLQESGTFCKLYNPISCSWCIVWYRRRSVVIVTFTRTRIPPSFKIVGEAANAAGVSGSIGRKFR